jgi:hypothetical protein
MFMSEVRFFRRLLAISWEFGTALRKQGILVPDAILDTGGVLYQLTPEKLERARSAVFLAKARQLRDSPLEAAPNNEIARSL